MRRICLSLLVCWRLRAQQASIEGIAIDEQGSGGQDRVRLQTERIYIKSMRLGGRPVEGGILDLSQGSHGADLSLLLSVATGSVSGTVLDDGGPAAGLVVILTASETDTGPKYRNATVGADGTYRFANVPPGKL
jgi:Carboxypeptidase regulatory-like domain